MVRDGSLRQGFLKRGVQALAHRLTDPLPYRLGHPLVDGLGEALAQPLGGAIEVESARSALSFDERRTDLLPEPLPKKIADALSDHVAEAVTHHFRDPLPQRLADALARDVAKLLRPPITALAAEAAPERLAATPHRSRCRLDGLVQPLEFARFRLCHRSRLHAACVPGAEPSARGIDLPYSGVLGGATP
jgi:hypothetical protein